MSFKKKYNSQVCVVEVCGYLQEYEWCVNDVDRSYFLRLIMVQ